MPSSSARATARSWSAGAPLIISPPTAPQPKPRADSSSPVRPNLRFSTTAASAIVLPNIRSGSNRRGGGLSIQRRRAMAAATAAIAADPELIDDLVAANHILYNEGVVDGFGHISVRHDKASERFLLARSMAPGLVTAADIMQFDRDGEAIDAQGRTPYLERFIHSEIYKLRPDVVAVVHSHSPSVIPFGVVATRLEPIYHMSSFLGAGVPIFEIRDAAGPATDMLVRNPALGAALAKTLGQCAVSL